MATTDELGDLLPVVRRARGLLTSGRPHEAIELLTAANRADRSAVLERELVSLRRRGGHRLTLSPPVDPTPIGAVPSDGTVFEVRGADLTADSLREGWARSGCVLVRGLASPERAAELVAGIDTAFAAFDAAFEGDTVDPAWYDEGPMPDRVSPGLPAPFRRKLLRDDGGVWTVDSPRMLFELFELIDGSGVGRVMTEFLGERPVLSAIKGTLRRVQPFDMDGGWHQDGAFLGDGVGACNVWLSLSSCGRDAPGLDVVPKRFDRVFPPDERAQFDWSVSQEGVLEAAGDTPVLRLEFEPGDALLFDHRLLHRTGASAAMTQPRYAIESWFFGPSAYPTGQLPILY